MKRIDSVIQDRYWKVARVTFMIPTFKALGMSGELFMEKYGPVFSDYDLMLKLRSALRRY